MDQDVDFSPPRLAVFKKPLGFVGVPTHLLLTSWPHFTEKETESRLVKQHTQVHYSKWQSSDLNHCILPPLLSSKA